MSQDLSEYLGCSQHEQHASKLTCSDDCSDEQACLGGHLVDALQSCLKAGMEVGKQHAMNPHIPI